MPRSPQQQNVASRARPVEPDRPARAARTGPVRVHTWAVPLAERMGRWDAFVVELGLDGDVPGRSD